MNTLTATTNLIAVSSSGEETPHLTVEIGTPYEVSATEWRCPVALDGHYEKVADAGGSDSLQALTLAVFLVQSLLAHIEEKGGRLLNPLTREAIAVKTYFPEIG